MALNPGDIAPDFTAETQTGETVSLHDFVGKKVALYFYPKDDTPGCTAQACNLRDNYQTLLAKGIQVIGVSTDSVASHKKFADKYSLPFPLVADPEQKIVNDYGVWVEKNMYGKKYMGTSRVTYMISEAGVIEKVIEKVKTADHAEQL
jgi:thioredoxin-dependent peroxiredoxin